MRWYAPWLYPFALLYNGVTKARNKLFDRGTLPSFNPRIPTVVVGNLNVGGSGKTPMVEFLIESFADQYRTVTLSRGYGRKTKGFVLATRDTSPEQIGDEPFQIFAKYKEKIHVAVGEKRVDAAQEILSQLPETQLLLLDDAFQHRYIQGDVKILLTTFQGPFFEDHLLPAGTLRESRAGAARADIIVVTKCPNELQASQKERFLMEISRYSKAMVLFAGLGYGSPKVVSGKEQGIETKKVIALSGIADNGLFLAEAMRRFEVLEVLDFPDHHAYKESDMAVLKQLSEKHVGAAVLTTEKDAVKLKSPAFREYLAEIPIFALPVNIKLSDADAQVLRSRVKQSIEEKLKIREV
jgi:tetraacyldisaccharide 4'-kinase